MIARSSVELRRLLELAPEGERSDLLDELATQVVAGGEGAAAALAWAVRHFQLARPALRAYLISDADVDAAEQATLVAVAFRMGSFRGDAKFTTWLHRVATNEARQLIRSERRHTERAEPGDIDEYAEQFVETVSSMLANHEVVQQAIAGLSPNHRRAMVLREDQGYSYEEVASHLGVPVGTAKTWVRRGRAELAVALREQFRRS